MSLGRASKIIVITFLVIPFAFQRALSETPPVHENFEEAEKNLEILLSLLEDSKVLSEETLSYLVNMEYSPENMSIVMAKANEFHELLEGAEILLEEMKGEATSYEYLEEYLTSFQNLDFNTTSLILFYSHLKENLTIAEDYFNDTGSSNITADDAFESLNNTEINAEQVKDKMEDIENNTNEINEKGFSTITLDELIIESKQLIGSEENTTKELAELFTVIPNYLSIYADMPDIALGDELIIYGYFFAEGIHIPGQNITVFIDNQMLGKVLTNSTGRYEFKKYIPLHHTLGKFEIYTSTIYNDSLYESDRIHITVGRTPIKLTLLTPYPAYSPKQPIPFFGRLVDYRGKGLADENITLYFDNPLGNTPYFYNITITNIFTDIEGNYSFKLKTTEIPIGIYVARAKFKSNDVYIGRFSKKVNVTINIPTNLALSILETVVFEGENITFFGQLIDELDNILLSDMTIEIYIEDEKVGEVVTNNLGQYKYVYSTSGMAVGNYNVHSEFNPIEVKWRKAKSDILEVEIKEPEVPTTQSKSLFEKIYDNLLLIVLLILVFLLSVVLYARKKRPVPDSVHQIRPLRKKLVTKSYPEGAITEKLLKETEDLDNKLKVLKETKSLRETIIIGYHTLLSILEKNKVLRVKPSYTHLDIAQKLTDNGFPLTEIHSITTIFEKAMYSNHPIKSHTLDDFMVGIKKMFTRAGGTKG